jgi:protein-L-isoaspartate(D-aspartate) O-methyltransferase
MVSEQIAARGIRDERLLDAMRRVPRRDFLPPEQRPFAYEDRWLPIEYEQHISQPYTVAAMIALALVDESSRVLEIGTGSGYGAAVLAEVASEVYSIEILEPLFELAGERLRHLGYDEVHLRLGDGYRGWPEAAPFDAIIVTAAAPRAPAPLIDQLRLGGRLVIPIGRSDADQQLTLYEKTRDGVVETLITPAYFVPMRGEVRR